MFIIVFLLLGILYLLPCLSSSDVLGLSISDVLLDDCMLTMDVST